MNRLLSIFLTTVIVSLTGFYDYNNNGALDQGEPLLGGRFEVYVTAGDGAVSMTVVQLLTGHWYTVEGEDDDRVEVVSECDSVRIQQAEFWYVPVRCGVTVWLPVVVR